MKRIYWQYLVGVVMTALMTVPGLLFIGAPKMFFGILLLVGGFLFLFKKEVPLMFSASLLSFAAAILAVLIVRNDVNVYMVIGTAVLTGYMLALPQRLEEVSRITYDHPQFEEEPVTVAQIVGYLFAQFAIIALILDMQTGMVVSGVLGIIFLTALGHRVTLYHRNHCPACLGHGGVHTHAA